MRTLGLSARVAAGAVAGALAITGCTPRSPIGSSSKSEEPSQPPPCSGSALTHAEVDGPSIRRPPGEFTTDGSELHFSASGFSYGNVFDSPNPHTEVFVGPADTPPTLTERPFGVTPLTKQFRAQPGKWTAVQLPAGNYWIWSSSAVNIQILACTANAVTVTKLRGSPAPDAGASAPPTPAEVTSSKG